VTRTYELVFVADPRVSDEDVVAMTEDYKAMITSAGAEIVRVSRFAAAVDRIDRVGAPAICDVAFDLEVEAVQDEIPDPKAPRE